MGSPPLRTFAPFAVTHTIALFLTAKDAKRREGNSGEWAGSALDRKTVAYDGVNGRIEKGPNSPIPDPA